MLPQHRVKGHQLVNVDRLQLQLGRGPFFRLGGYVPKLILQRVEHHQRRAALLRIVLNQPVDFPLQFFGDFKTHRSHSPITKSSDPKIATTSLIMCPGRVCDRILRFANEGARIFNRYGTPPPLLKM